MLSDYKCKCFAVQLARNVQITLLGILVGRKESFLYINSLQHTLGHYVMTNLAD